MSVVDLATLKSYFQTGDKPTQGEFENLIDTLGQFVGVLVPFKLELSTADCFAADSYAIPELIALPAGQMWQIVGQPILKYNFNSVDFDVLNAEIFFRTGTDYYFRAQVTTFNSRTESSVFTTSQQGGSMNDILVESDSVQLTITSPATVGDASVTIYGFARIITL